MALRLAGEPFDEHRLRAHVNVSDYTQLPASYTYRAGERLAECERTAIDRFYESNSVPVHVLECREARMSRV